MASRSERQACLNEELARIRRRLSEIEQMDGLADRRIRSADNVDTASLKLIGFFGVDSPTGQVLEDIRNAFVVCQFLKQDAEEQEDE